MTLFIGSFGILSIILSLVFNLNVLNSKPLISQAFFTDEQKLKVYLYNLIMFSIILAFIGVVLFMTLKNSGINNQSELDAEILVQGLGIAIITFLISVFIVGHLARWFQNFRMKYHYKFRVDIPSVGPVYVISMLDKEVCICSKDPNLGYRGSKSTKSSYLIAKEDIMRLPLTITKQTKPKKTKLEKFID